MTLIELLNHPCFRSLERRGDHWAINHISHDGVSIAAVTATDLDQVIEDFGRVVESIWLYEDELPDDYDYDANFHRSEIRDGVRMFPQ